MAVDGVRRAGFNTPSRKLEFYSPTLAEWGWPEHAIPRYVPGHVYWRDLDRVANEFDLLPNFRLPTLIHTRSPVKWLYEISHNNPLWIATGDAAKLGVEQGDLVKVQDRHRALRHPRVGHRRHPPRRRRHVAPPRPLAAQRGSGRRPRGDVTREDQRAKTAATRCARCTARKPFESDDPDSGRVWWSEVGVHQNMTFPVQPDPVSGMHCWHQRVKVEKAARRRLATATSSSTPTSRIALYKEWMAKTRPAPGPDGTRRPFWFDRPLRPVKDAYKMP